MRRNALRFASTLYLPRHRNPQTKRFEADKDGYLFAKGLYRTKIRAEDLPDWYVKGNLYDQEGYISAKGVKSLLYKPNYATWHLHKNDFLFISYNAPIEPDPGDIKGIWYHGYDHVVWGDVIVPFLKAAHRYSDYDISDLMKEVHMKEQWHQKNYGE